MRRTMPPLPADVLDAGFIAYNCHVGGPKGGMRYHLTRTTAATERRTACGETFSPISQRISPHPRLHLWQVRRLPAHQVTPRNAPGG
jgi:hypothetical protein